MSLDFKTGNQELSILYVESKLPPGLPKLKTSLLVFLPSTSGHGYFFSTA